MYFFNVITLKYNIIPRLELSIFPESVTIFIMESPVIWDLMYPKPCKIY